MKITVFYLDTHHNTRLGIKNGLLGHAGRVENRICFFKIDSHNALILPEGNLDFIESAEKTGEPWAYDAKADKGVIQIVKYFEQEDGSIRILSFAPRLHYSALKPEPDAKFTAMEARTIHFCNWQKFYPLQASDREKICLGWADSLRDYFINGKLSPQHFAESAMYRTLAAQLLGAEQFQELGMEAGLVTALEDDSGLFANAVEGQALLGVESDWLASEYHNFLKNFGDETMRHARRAVARTQDNCCVATIASRDGLYLAEFVAWYQALGVNRIIIYSTDESDASGQLLKTLSEKGHIEWIRIEHSPEVNPQFKALAHFSGHNATALQHKFVLYVDTGEFLWLDPDLFCNIDEFLDYHEQLGSGSIALSRLHVGSNNNIYYDERPFVERFPVASASADYNIKHFFRPHLAASMQIHFPIAASGREIQIHHSDGTVYTNWKHRKQGAFSLAFADNRPITHAALFNYYHKSLEEFAYKFIQPYCDHDLSHGEKIALEGQARLFLRNFTSPEQGIQISEQLNTERFNFAYQHLMRHPQVYDAVQKTRDGFYLKRNELLFNIEKIFSYNAELQDKYHKILAHDI